MRRDWRTIARWGGTCLAGALVLASLALGCTAPAASAPPPDDRIAVGLDVATSDGSVRGASANGARSWKGIPYAAPPTGANRFRAPQPAMPWTSPRDATAFGQTCAQTGADGNFASGSDDCLFLNVWSPDPAPTAARPVMVYLHGGAFIINSGSAAILDGTKLAATEDVVLVTLNYRLGPLGFLAHPALAAEAPANGTGTYGLQDQRAALRWVQKNIRAFGGDPDDVTLFGESAGGWSVTMHLASPGSAGLFHRAIIQSGATPARQHMPTVAEAENQTAQLAAALGCAEPVVACLRGKSFQDVTAGSRQAAPPPGGVLQNGLKTPLWLPVMDGAFLPEQPGARYAAGKVAVVPTLLGSDADEGRVFHVGVMGDAPVKTEAEYESAIGRMVGADAPKVVARYPAASFESFDAALAQIDSDAVFTCPTRSMARSLSAAGAPVFRYQLRRGPDFGVLASLGPTHASDLPFVFGNDDPVQGGVDERGQPLRDAVMGYWTRFAGAGDPNGGGDPAWPGYDAAKDTFLALDVPPVAAQGVQAEACDFWDGLAPLSFVRQ